MTCSSGSCCAPETPVGCGGTCCAGNACCGPLTAPVCQTAHSNGLGQLFFDCNPLGTHNLDSARAAAHAWNASGTEVNPLSLACTSCVGWLTNDACSVWCWGSDPLGGHVNLDTISVACLCPGTGSPAWN